MASSGCSGQKRLRTERSSFLTTAQTTSALRSAVARVNDEKDSEMAKTIATILGIVFILVGLVGFAAPNLMGAHFSTAHNVIHLVSGAAALYLGLAGSLSAAKMFCLAFGAVYLLLGLAGFVIGG